MSIILGIIEVFAIALGILAASHVLAKSSARRREGTGQIATKPVLSWLTEQYDKTDLKETWLMTMEIAITLLVGGELFVELWNLCHH